MNKKTTQDGVQIAGYEKLDQENPTSKGKRSNEGNNTKKLKKKDESKRTENRGSNNPTQGCFSHGNK